MTQDEIIEMAAEIWNAGSSFPIPSSDDILHFAKLVAAKEREACAKVCDDIQDCGPENGCCPTFWGEALDKAEIAIRARGQA
jgi:hypothetical protein